MSTMKIIVPDEFKRWWHGLDDFEIGSEEVALFKEATEVFFDETQRRVHVLSGDLKRSGRITDPEMTRDEVSLEVWYGGTVGSRGRTVDYWQYEVARGGKHDFVRPAAQKTQRTFEEAVIDMMTRLLDRKVS